MKKLGLTFTAAVLAGGLTGCAGTHFPANPFGNPGNNTVSNKPGDQGPKAYGSEACRTAGIDVVPGAAFSRRYGAGTSWGRGALGLRYYGYYNRYPEFRSAISVTSVNGFSYNLTPTSLESYLFRIAGGAAGAAAGIEAARRGGYGGGYRYGRGATTTFLGAAGAALGGAVGTVADNLWNAGAREAGDRCRADAINGAYDPERRTAPTARMSTYGELGAPRPGEDRSGYGAPAPLPSGK